MREYPIKFPGHWTLKDAVAQLRRRQPLPAGGSRVWTSVNRDMVLHESGHRIVTTASTTTLGANAVIIPSAILRRHVAFVPFPR
jgi:hypothetical protein